MEEIEKDPRFAHTLKDPRFRQPKVNYAKTKIDSRFKRMLSDKEFSAKYTVDKRGRPINTSAEEQLDRLYNYDSEEESSDSDDEDDEKEEPSSDNALQKEESGDDSEQDEEEKQQENERVHLGVRDKDEDSEESDSSSGIPEITEDGPDYARGGALLESSDDDDEDAAGEGEDDDLDLDEPLLDHHWNELDHDAPTTDDSTHRLAMCHMDWDRIKAKDIFVLCNSFVPQGGAVKTVTVYPSEEGLKRMAEEARLGPREFREAGEEGGDGVGDSKAVDQALLRKYQLQRLSYFYAVIVCDSVATADKIYQECNGMEYEKSSNEIDLRFIPDDMTFDQEPRETCTGVEDMSNFQPSTYRTTALCQDKVDLTWDETSIDRLKKTMKQFTEEDCDNDDAYAELVASSDEPSSSEPESEAEGAKKNKKNSRKSAEAEKTKWRERLRQSLNLDSEPDGKKKKKKKKKPKIAEEEKEEDSEEEEDFESWLARAKSDGHKTEEKKKKTVTKKKKVNKVRSEEESDEEEEDKKKKKKKVNKVKGGDSEEESEEEEEDTFMPRTNGEKKKKKANKMKGGKSVEESDEEEKESFMPHTNGDKKKKKKLNKLKGGKSVEENDEEEERFILRTNGDGKKTKGEKTKQKKRKNDADEEEESEEGGMEYTWQPAAVDKNKKKQKSKEKLTPWEAFEQKKKDKKKEKKKRRKLEKLKQQGYQDTTELGFDDPFFNEDPEKDQKKKKKDKFKKKKRGEEAEEDTEESRKEKAALGLLVSDGDKRVKGFNLRTLMKEQKALEKKKGKKRKQNQMEGNADDSFQLKLDDRFGNLFTDPDLHSDPNAPEFKKTKEMLTLMQEIAAKKRKKAL